MRWKVVALLLAALVAIPTVAGADKRDIVIVNRAGDVITSLYVSPVDADDWEEDVLGVDVLGDGESVLVTFSGYDPGECQFDILATNEDGEEWLLPDVDLCEVSEVVITAEDIRAR